MKRFLTLVIALLTVNTLAQEPTKDGWEAILTTDTDIVFSVKLAQKDYSQAKMATFPLRIWHPDKRVDEFEVTMWSNGKGTFKRMGDINPAPEPKLLDPESPLGRVHLRVFDPEAFKEWDDSLDDLGPRHEELYEDKKKEE